MCSDNSVQTCDERELREDDFAVNDGTTELHCAVRQVQMIEQNGGFGMMNGREGLNEFQVFDLLQAQRSREKPLCQL